MRWAPRARDADPHSSGRRVCACPAEPAPADGEGESRERGRGFGGKQPPRLDQMQPAGLRAGGQLEKARSFPAFQTAVRPQASVFLDPAFFSAQRNPTSTFLPTSYSSFLRKLRIQLIVERTPYSSTRAGNSVNDCNNNSLSECLPFVGTMRFTLSPVVYTAA